MPAWIATAITGSDMASGCGSCATASAASSLDAAVDQFGLEQVIAITLPDNLASRRVMEKSGFFYSREIEHVGLRHVLYLRDRC